MGIAPAGKPQTTAEVRTASVGSPVVVRGEMVEKCPTSGCWFVLKDGKGTMKVDLAATKFVAVDVPLHSTVTVGGKAAGTGDGRFLDANGLRY